MMGAVLAAGLGSRQADARALVNGAGLVGQGQGGDFVLAGPLYPAGWNSGEPADSTPTVQLTHFTGPCLPCNPPSLYPPGYDPSRGYFVMTITNALLGTNFYFGRPPYGDHRIDMGSFGETMVYFYLSKDKGCGDFLLLFDGPDGVPIIAAQFKVPCTSYRDDFTINGVPISAPGQPVRRFTMANIRGMSLAGGAGPSASTVVGQQVADLSAEYSPPTTPARDAEAATGVITFELRNATETWMAMELLVPPSDPVQAGSSILRLGTPPAPRWMAPGGTISIPVDMELNWGDSSGSTTAMPVEVTSTVVFSVGPTTQFTGTLFVTQGYELFAPLLLKQLATGW